MQTSLISILFLKLKAERFNFLQYFNFNDSKFLMILATS